MATLIGDLRERLTILTPTAPAIVLASVVQTDGAGVATAGDAHGYSTGDYVTLGGATVAGWNVRVKITVTSPTEFTFAIDAALPSPAVGAILTARYFSDKAGGRRSEWYELDTVAAKLDDEAMAEETLQFGAIQSATTHRFTIHRRSDVAPSMRLMWLPSFSDGEALLLAVTSARPVGDGRAWTTLKADEVPK